MYDEWGNGWDTSQDLMYCSGPLDDWAKFEDYELPNPNAPGYLDYTESLVREGFSESHIVTSYHFCSLFERAYMLRGFENIMEDMLLEEELLSALLDKITDFQIALAKRYVEVGVNCGRTVDDYGSQASLLISPHLWRKFIKPRLSKILDVYHNAGLPVIHHSCGNVTAILDDFVEIGINVLNPVQPAVMDMEVLSSSYGDKLTFFGGICNQTVMPDGNAESVDAHVKQQVKALGAHGRYVISPSNGVGADVPLENIEAYFTAAEKYRRI